MKTPDEETQHKVKEWLVYADEDLRFAQIGLSLSGEQLPPYHLIAYHAQQCAEKCLKAYLIFHGVDFPRTHNISTLLELCSDYDDWPLTLRDAEELTDYAVATRYPGEVTEVTGQDAQRAIEHAERVRTQVHSALQKFGVKSSGEGSLPGDRIED